MICIPEDNMSYAHILYSLRAVCKTLSQLELSFKKVDFYLYNI